MARPNPDTHLLTLNGAGVVIEHWPGHMNVLLPSIECQTVVPLLTSAASALGVPPVLAPTG